MKKNVKCEQCKKIKPQLDFDWLPRQQKYHFNCTNCTNKLIKNNGVREQLKKGRIKK